MRALARLLVVLGIALLGASANGAPVERRPSIGYLYTAGGQQGETIRVIVGGQNLRGVRKVFVTGEGVRGKFIKHHGNTQRFRTDVYREVRKRIQRATRKLVNELRNRGKKVPPRRGRKRGNPKKGAAKKAGDAKKAEGAEPEVVVPDHPLLRDLEKMTFRELKKVGEYFFDPTRRVQESPQIAEAVEIEIAIAADAPPGDREVRLGTGLGLSNPMIFEVGTLRETREVEPNDFRTVRQEVATLPVVLNGQISVRDLDRFRFRAEKGQTLVIAAQARRLVPYLADAVPGWFQATMSLHDASGNEVAFSDDFRFDPDPVILFEVPKTGEYELTVRDSIDRGREDFVYRITISERPWITHLFPLGGPKDVATTAAISGWNLPMPEVGLDTRGRAGVIREVVWPTRGGLSNRVRYAVDDLPECVEAEPNDTLNAAQVLRLPIIVNGRSNRDGDADLFRFGGRAGDTVVLEVTGRRLDSPIDSRIELLDPSGRVIAGNDDHPDPMAGLVTHQADSYLLAKLPADGAYTARLTDAQGKGGPEYAYRLRVSPARPDFDVIVTPSCINVNAGRAQIVTVHAVRRDGFAGDIELTLVDPLPGFLLSGARIPAGRAKVRMTLTAPGNAPGLPVVLHLAAHAKIGGARVTRRAVPAEDRMQAFGLRHLVRAEELLVSVRRAGRGRKPMRLAALGPILIPAGQTAVTRVIAPGLPRLDDVRFVLDEAPPGISLVECRSAPGGLEVVLKAEGDKAPAGFADNLIIAAYTETMVGRGGKKGGPKKKRRVFIGVLPAIPIEVVGP